MATNNTNRKPTHTAYLAQYSGLYIVAECWNGDPDDVTYETAQEFRSYTAAAAYADELENNGATVARNW